MATIGSRLADLVATPSRSVRDHPDSTVERSIRRQSTTHAHDSDSIHSDVDSVIARNQLLLENIAQRRDRASNLTRIFMDETDACRERREVIEEELRKLNAKRRDALETVRHAQQNQMLSRRNELRIAPASDATTRFQRSQGKDSPSQVQAEYEALQERLRTAQSVLANLNREIDTVASQVSYHQQERAAFLRESDDISAALAPLEEEEATLRRESGLLDYALRNAVHNQRHVSELAQAVHNLDLLAEQDRKASSSLTNVLMDWNKAEHNLLSSLRVLQSSNAPYQAFIRLLQERCDGIHNAAHLWSINSRECIASLESEAGILSNHLKQIRDGELP